MIRAAGVCKRCALPHESFAKASLVAIVKALEAKSWRLRSRRRAVDGEGLHFSRERSSERRSMLLGSRLLVQAYSESDSELSSKKHVHDHPFEHLSSVNLHGRTCVGRMENRHAYTLTVHTLHLVSCGYIGLQCPLVPLVANVEREDLRKFSQYRR